jgi:error-prone DNA polymerase
MRRSQEKMRKLEAKLRAGMAANSVDPAAQEQIVQSISSFALYGFPESHAASFALIAYASAYIKEHYLAAFTCATLNNQPMGFYSPATIVKDAQRHHLKVRVIDVQHSRWECTLEALYDEAPQDKKERFALRLGLGYARGIRKEAGLAIVATREMDGPFASIYDLARRVPALRKNELVILAQIGALNSLGEKIHRRDALWQAERAGQLEGPLLRSTADAYEEQQSPLFQMTTEERLVADFRGTGLTVGRHPMAYHREQLNSMGVIPANRLHLSQGIGMVKICGCVIARQRPQTAKGFVFLSVEDETGISNAIVDPDLFEKNRSLVSNSTFLLIEGILQNQDNVISVKALAVHPLPLSAAEVRSHDFH